MILVSIIIASAGLRPELLKKAINSAMINDSDIQTEIIVVLNGDHIHSFDMNLAVQNPSVKYFKLQEGNVSKARNYGIQKANGEYIRFLDDDDTLISNAHKQQVLQLKSTNEDVSSYSIDIYDDKSNYYGRSHNVKDGENAIIKTFQVNSVILIHAHLYRADFIKDCRWNENRCNAEDLEWLHSILRKFPKWKIYNECVGIWYQHNDENRLSFVSINQDATKVCAEQLIKSYEFYKENNINIENLELHVAKGLWGVIHKAFYLSPVYWTKMALYALKLDPKSHPKDAIFQFFPFPILIEWVMIPKRLGNFFWRILKGRFQKNHYIRKF